MVLKLNLNKQTTGYKLLPQTTVNNTTICLIDQNDDLESFTFRALRMRNPKRLRCMMTPEDNVIKDLKKWDTRKANETIRCHNRYVQLFFLRNTFYIQ